MSCARSLRSGLFVTDRNILSGDEVCLMKGGCVVCRSPADRGWLESGGWSEALTAVRIGAQWWALCASAEQDN